MDRFCKEGSEGCSQEDILLETRDMEGLGLQLDLPAGFCPMDEERQEKLYPWEGRPPLLWENGAVQLTGQLTEQKLDPGETWQAAWALWELTEELFPEQAVSPVYLGWKGRPAGGLVPDGHGTAGRRTYQSGVCGQGADGVSDFYLSG